MKLLVVSHTPHYRRADGEIVGWGPTVRELDHLATQFDGLVHLAPLHPGNPPASCAAYGASTIDLRPVSPAGGPRLIDKLAIFGRYPGYLIALLREVRRADAIHVRCPANISMLAIVVVALLPNAIRRQRPWWVKYAGNWAPDGPETRSYRLQRAWLRRPWSGLTVTVNGRWPEQPPHIESFDNPCLDVEELAPERARIEGDTTRKPSRLLFVGALDRNKGAEHAITATGRLRSAGLEVTLDLVGDGPRRGELEALVDRLALGSSVRFHGATTRDAVGAFYRRAHILLVPSRTEGWPKVIAEALARGVVPIASRISCIPQILDEIGVGLCPDQRTGEAFAAAITTYIEDPARWRAERLRGNAAAGRFTYDAYLDAVAGLFGEPRRSDDPES